MRKIVILIAISAFILGLDCLPAPAQKTITVMLFPQYVRELNDLLIDQMNEWAKQRGVKVRADVVSTREAETRQMAEMAAGEGHDVVFFRSGFVTFKDALLNLDDFAEELTAANGEWDPGAKEECMIEGHWKAIPWMLGFNAFVYRTDYFKQIGVTREQVHKMTWDDLLTWAPKLQAIGHPGGFAISQLDPGDSNQPLWCLLWSYGSYPVTAKREITIDSAATVLCIKYIKELYKYMPEGVLAWDGGANNRAMLSGYASWTSNKPSIYATALVDAPEIARNLDHATHPAGPRGAFHWQDFGGPGIWKFLPPDRQQLAKDLIRYIFKKENYEAQIEIAKGHLLPAFLPLQNHPVFRRDPALSALSPLERGEKHYAGWPAPQCAETTKMVLANVIPNMFGKAVVGIPIQEAIDWAEEELTRIFHGK